MMDELGQLLREARETKGYTLQEVQEQTRINQRFIEALESGEYDLLPTPVHVRGFLRNYARFLGLDATPLLDRYEIIKLNQPRVHKEDALIQAPAPVAPALRDLPEENPFFDPVNMEVDAGYGRAPRQSADSVLRLVIIGALIVFIILAANRFLPLILGNDAENAQLTEAITTGVANVLSQETAEPADEVDGTATVGPSSVLAPTGRNDIPDDGSAASSDRLVETVVVPTRPALPPTLETIELRLDIYERTWMEVTIDGDVLFSGIARPTPLNEPYEWTASEEAKILTGNAAGIYVTINEIEWGILGGYQENVEQVWQTTQ